MRGCRDPGDVRAAGDRHDGEPPRIRDGLWELGRLVTGRARRDAFWRAFWTAWLPLFSMIVAAFWIIGAELFSIAGLALLVALDLLALGILLMLRRLGYPRPFQ